MKTFKKAFYFPLLFLMLLFSTPSFLVADTISISINSTNDDAEERLSGSVYLDSSDLEIVFDGSSQQIIGMRFNRVMLPSNATVSNAYIQFTVDETDSGTANVIVYGESNINPVDFSSQDIISRTSTASSVNWSNIPAWTTVGDATSDQQTPNLTNIVNDIIGLASWESGNSMVFMIKAGSPCSNSDCQRTAESYDGTSSSAAKLIIEYTLPTTFHAYNDFTNAMPDSSVVIDILTNDIAGVGETLVNNSVAIITPPANGTYSINTINGSITYSPNSGFTGTDTLTYTVENSSPATSNIAKVSIDVGYIVGDRDFTVRNPSDTRNIRGNYKIGGNINLCTYDEDTSDDPTSTGNAKPWSGECYQTYSNSHPSSFLDIDSDSSTVNSSSFELDLPTDSEVVWAGLYWQGVVHNSDLNEDFMDYQTISGAPQISSNKGLDLTNNTYGADKVKFKIPGGSYIEVTAQQLDFSDLGYAGFIDVTSMLNATSPNGVYTVADIKSHQGTESNHGNYAGWALVVIYENPNEDFRNITLFDGFVTVTSSYNSDLVIDGFLTPKTAPINSKLAFFTMDGDNGTNSLHIINESGVSTEVVDPNGIAGHSLFDASIQGVNNRNPLVPSARMDLDIIDLVNVLGPLETSATLRPRSGGDRYTASFFVMSSDLYAPKLCYDYAYSQYGQFFTEDYNTTSSPSLKGNIISGEPVEIKFYIKNTENSDFIADNLKVSVLDLNISQATYKDDSTYVTYPNSLLKNNLLDSSLTIANDKSSVEDIDIGVVDSLEHFYTYLNLDTTTSTLDMPLNVKINYDLKSSPDSNLTLNIPYDAYLKDMDICSGSSTYNPGKGIFNVVHNSYYNYDSGGANRYYNLPTQVTSREGNFKVISLDVNNTDELEPTSTMVAVEMIDVSAFHDTNASCQEQDSSISERVWVMFDTNTTSTMFDQNALQNSIALNMTQLNNSFDFYKNARENTAFRVSYNDPNDNDTLLEVSPGTKVGTYNINFPDLTTLYGTQCAGGQYVVYDKDKDKTTNQIPVACKSNSDITPENLQSCMECIYGYNTKFVCSRDNFSIRPEAFMMHLYDQNQTNPTNPLTPPELLTTNFSGVSQAITSLNITDIDIAADYRYNIEINATNHINNTSSPGYIKSISSTSIDDSSEYTWEPRGLTALQLAARNLACNDDTNKSVDIRFFNGAVDINTSVNQVGEYRLNIIDTTWTAVDSDIAYMTHHANSFFYPGDGSISLDCISGSATQDVNSALLNGCDTSSSHTNNDANLTYNDYNVTFHPYDINVTTGLTMGLTARVVNAGDDFSNFVYMANINADENMSVQLNTTIYPSGRHSNTSLSNFVTGCYAKPLDINISKSAPINTTLIHRYALRDINSTGDEIISNDRNSTIGAGVIRDANLTTTNLFFQKDMNGVITTITSLNFDRNQNVGANPEDINFTAITAIDPLTNFNADLTTTKKTRGDVSINGLSGQNITHYFGRTAARKTRIVCDVNPCVSGQNGEPDVLIYYEAYCYGTTNNNTCDRTLLPTLTGRYIQKVDSRWYVNLNHTEAGDGNLTATQEVAGFVSVPNITILNNYTKNSAHSYNTTNGLPYDADMNSSIPRWLIYDEDNAAATSNKHKVIFQSATTWTGEHETNTTTKTEKVRRVNRRTMW